MEYFSTASYHLYLIIYFQGHIATPELAFDSNMIRSFF